MYQFFSGQSSQQSNSQRHGQDVSSAAIQADMAVTSDKSSKLSIFSQVQFGEILTFKSFSKLVTTTMLVTLSVSLLSLLSLTTNADTQSKLKDPEYLKGLYNGLKQPTVATLNFNLNSSDISITSTTSIGIAIKELKKYSGLTLTHLEGSISIDGKNQPFYLTPTDPTDLGKIETEFNKTQTAFLDTLVDLTPFPPPSLIYD
jgi:hypothetical protein